MAVKKRPGTVLLILILAGESVFLLPFVLPRIFRPTVLDFFGINNTQLGSYFSVYGLVAVICYLMGGQLADRISSRRLMSSALFLTASGGIALAFFPITPLIPIVYGFWGFTTIFLFWAGMIRATREWGGAVFQGRAFGWLEGGRGLVAAIIGTLTWLLFNRLSYEGVGSEPGECSPYRVILMVTSVFIVAVGLIVRRFIPDNRSLLTRDPLPELIQKIRSLLRNPSIWLLSLIIVLAYSGYKITDDLSLYAREVLGYSEVGAAAVGTSALWLRGISAILVGVIADRTKKPGLLSLAFLLAMAGSLLIASGLVQWSHTLTILNIIALAMGLYALRAMYFAVQKEANIPLAMTGTAVGILSFAGYTPDIYMGPLMGVLLDRNPGAKGHQYVFLVLAGFSFLGLITSLMFRRVSRRALKPSFGNAGSGPAR